MNVCFFCAASDVDVRYTEPARQLARMVVEEGHTLVWGGSDRGLMREIASAAQDVGGKIVGITMESLKHTARQNADEMIVTADLAERKKVMMERSDAVITLVGGTGTLDEMTELFELRRHGVHNETLIILNTDGFYDGLKMQYERMKQDGFLDRLPRPFDQLIAFADTPEQVMELLGMPPTQPFTDGAPMPISNEAI
ncbi:MAG TPA: TIGR00730 family Rossman fold protein [Candidatus Saccharimonadales bacterium]|nr:TIGR00730 family Rossman fold protein [Candidatus Saccharimonadales bacterium]